MKKNLMIAIALVTAGCSFNNEDSDSNVDYTYSIHGNAEQTSRQTIDMGGCYEIANSGLSRTFMTLEDGKKVKINTLGSGSGIAVTVIAERELTGSDQKMKKSLLVKVHEGGSHLSNVAHNDAFNKSGWIDLDYSISSSSYDEATIERMEIQAWNRIANAKIDASRCQAKPIDHCSKDCSALFGLEQTQCLNKKADLQCPDYGAALDDQACSINCSADFASGSPEHTACIGRKFEALNNMIMNWDKNACGGFAQYTCGFDCGKLTGTANYECRKQHKLHCD